MKKYIFILSVLGIMGSMSSCKKYPEACLTIDKTEITLGESITVTDCSENSERAVIDLGDGMVHEGNSHSHTYTKEGSYLVTLKAFSKKDKYNNSASRLVTVNPVPVPPPPAPPKVRYLSGIRLLAYPPTKPGGGAWDSGNDPDIRMRVSIQNSNFGFTTSTQTDLATVALPFTWDYSPSPFKLTDANWTLRMFDFDPGILGIGDSEELMAEWTINPSSVTISGNRITLSTTDGALVELLLELRDQ
jgi:hypothetical protein